MCNVNIGGARSQKRNWRQPKKKSRVSRPITPEVLGLEKNRLYLWVASVVLHPNMKLDWLGAAILCPGKTTMQRHPESVLRACTMEILYTTLSGSKKIKHQQPPSPWILGESQRVRYHWEALLESSPTSYNLGLWDQQGGSEGPQREDTPRNKGLCVM